MVLLRRVYSGSWSPAEIVASTRPRAELLDALTPASASYELLLELIATAPTPERARTALIDRFSLSETAADAVLAMRLRRLTTSERHRIVAERDEVHQQIRDNQP